MGFWIYYRWSSLAKPERSFGSIVEATKKIGVDIKKRLPKKRVIFILSQ